ncbi:MAG: hypothetical protein LBC58_01780, partial [Clostridiales Family XIII bacterium]|jgi:4-diphosphocytidyl-2-C-methyl-D-erythritol kinase|nr:hypothetical protein [Clostridiales Family XIII bacterium]
MQAVDLFDEVFVECGGGRAGGAGARISVDMRPAGAVIPETDNLAYKAAVLMAEHFAPAGAAAPPDLRILIHKNIPLSAGLAGGSSDAAAVMLALAGQWDIDADLARLCALSTEIGADVPFCLAANAKINGSRYAPDPTATSTALAEGIGDLLTPLPAPPGALIILNPDLALSTPHIYEVYDDAPEKAARPDTDGFLRELRGDGLSKAAPAIDAFMVNALEYAAASESPETARLLAGVKSTLPCAAVFLSGSGPSVAAYFPKRAEAEEALPLARERFEKNGVKVFFAPIL